MNLGTLIRDTRGIRGMSQTKLADMIGTVASQVSMWENDKSIPSKKSLEKLASVLDVSLDVLGGKIIITDIPDPDILPEPIAAKVDERELPIAELTTITMETLSRINDFFHGDSPFEKKMRDKVSKSALDITNILSGLLIIDQIMAD
jgi:transcriptional regulator with XRE-family HTH domain